ncbi:MAG: hypothetical protein Alis3KO_25840 [Aliiglaciecola sp.]
MRNRFEGDMQLLNLKNELDEAAELIERSGFSNEIVPTEQQFSLTSQVKETDSLLERCANIVSNEQLSSKPSLRIVHHFACSGGTLLSKCISSLPNVYLLSEIHPLSLNHLGSKPKYLPTDTISLARYAKVPDVDFFAKQLFLRNIQYTEKYISDRGGILVLREHTHIDYCLGKKASPYSVVDKSLNKHFDLKHVVTVRNPIDSYVSLKLNDWVQFSPPTFDEYCKRLLKFINRYSKKSIIKYEDFVEEPFKKIRKICKLLDLPYDERFIDIFDLFDVTGDSGRSGGSIEKRERRQIDSSLVDEIHASKNFNKVCKILKYEKGV